MKRIIFTTTLSLLTVIWARMDFPNFPVILVIFGSMAYFTIKRNQIFDCYSNISKFISLFIYFLLSLSLIAFLLSLDPMVTLIKINAIISLIIVMLTGLNLSKNLMKIDKLENTKLLKNLYFDFNLIALLFLIISNNFFS